MNRRVIVKHSSYLRLTHKYVQKDDLVCILHGSRTPVILRLVDSKDGHTRFTTLGQCYYENAMYGEAVSWDEEDAHIICLV
jgi:hypothetical protein